MDYQDKDCADFILIIDEIDDLLKILRLIIEYLKLESVDERLIYERDTLIENRALIENHLHNKQKSFRI